jgi:membrane-associated phospholipid phosphatase
MSIDDKARYAAAGFIALLIVSVLWPAPVVAINHLWLHRALGIDELSFLGREAPSWDVVFWCMAGLFCIAVVQSGDASSGDLRHALRDIRKVRVVLPRRFLAGLAVAAIVVAITCLAADGPLVAAAERVQSDTVENWIRILNRLSGGINPPMIVLFFIVAGIAYRRRAWFGYGVAMALAGITAGIVANVLKFVVGRTRPELWLGAFHYVRATAYSFPSGHTVAAFSLGGVLLFASRSVILRTSALLLACAVAFARVLAFRHWPSDVVASALIGLLAAWVASTAVTRVTSESITAV